MNQAVKAVLTVNHGQGARTRHKLHRVENFFVETAMDNDVDTWGLEIGDSDSHLLPIVTGRDKEIVASITAVATDAYELQRGIADQSSFSERGTMICQGRDLSSIATDSDAPPGEWKHVRPHKFIAQRARDLGFSKMKLSQVSPIMKLYTDGSETEWEFWWRIYRKKKMYIWTEPDGTLVADFLNYDEQARYLIGWPGANSSHPAKWIQPTSIEITKNTQNRLSEVWVFGERGDVGVVYKKKDKGTAAWLRQPFRLIQDPDVTSKTSARRTALLELFEGKVGEIEITVTIPDPGYIIRQNHMARIRIPQIDFSGDYFVVGNRIGAAPGGGLLQEVRLRERHYAMTHRVPDDPELQEVKGGTSLEVMAQNLDGARWQDAFVGAAREFCGPWDFSLFLGVLLSICEQETSFANVREGRGGRENEYYAYPGHGNLSAWRRLWANDPGSPGNPFGRDAGVGPMQLTSSGYKEKADSYGGKHDEYTGGRWMPEANVRAGAFAFKSKLAGIPASDANIWLGVTAYNGSEAYMREVRQRYNDHWKARVATAMQAAADASESTQASLPGSTPSIVKKMISYAENQIGDPYSWGAEGPTSFDCSGLVYAAYAHVGLGDDIGGRLSTWSYWNNGRGSGKLFKVYKNQLRPGDMVMYHNGTFPPPGHMALYIGSGKIIVAPHTGAYVHRDSLGIMPIVGCLRCEGVWPGNIPPHFPE